MQYQEEKFINALLFFGKKTNSKVFGITKLLKLLFLSDFRHFQKYGRPILGDVYFRLPQGPVPSISYSLFNDTFHLGQDTDLKKVARIISEKVDDYNLNRIEPLADPNLDVFSKSDLEIMENIAKKFYSKTGTEMVRDIHKIALIKDMKEGIKIDYKLILKNSADRAYIETLEKQEEGLVKALGSL